MSKIGIKDATTGETREVDTISRVEGGATVEVQAVAIINPVSGDPLLPNDQGRMPVYVPEVGTVEDAESEVGAGSIIALLKRLRTQAASVLARLPTLVNGGLRIAGYDAGDDMVKVKSVQKKFRDSFTGATLNAAKWESQGAGISVSGGTLIMASGTVANAEAWVLSKETFTIPFRVGIGLTLSNRIINQTFFVEAISVDPETGAPDGQHAIAFLFDGTVATNAKYRVQNSGAAPLDSAATAFPTTAGGSIYELEPFADEDWFHGGPLDSTSARTNSYRRHQQIPEPNAVFKLRLRWLNGAVAPASSVNAVVQYIQVQDYAELTAEITAGRGQSVAGQSLGVQVTNTPAVTVGSGTLTANIGTSGLATYTDSATNLAASATFTGTSRDGGATPAYNLFVANAFADQSGTLYVDKSTDGTTWRLAAPGKAVAANEAQEITVRATARYHRTRFVNGATLQTAFSLTSAYQRQ